MVRLERAVRQVLLGRVRLAQLALLVLELVYKIRPVIRDQKVRQGRQVSRVSRVMPGRKA